jgi:hypothetical protein
MRRPLLALVLALASCGQPATVANRAAEDNESAAADTVTAEALPVRIGELGASFRACSAAGTTRSLKAGETLPVHWAPYEHAREDGSVAVGARFFICTRSLDQKWFGIVFDEGGTLADRCGVAEPVTRRRDYDGPCRSGWVESAFVKVIAGDAPAPTPAPAPKGANSPAAGA